MKTKTRKQMIAEGCQDAIILDGIYSLIQAAERIMHSIVDEENMETFFPSWFQEIEDAIILYGFRHKFNEGKEKGRAIIRTCNEEIKEIKRLIEEYEEFVPELDTRLAQMAIDILSEAKERCRDFIKFG